MWSPTHIQVTVQRAKGLLTKGKNGTNNCFVTIGLGKEKYQTSVRDKAVTDVSWNEECELKIPDQGNRAELVLTCLHRNNLGIDEFLGQVTLPLNEMDAYDRPRSKWYKLESKPGKEKKSKERGELEVRIAFVVKSGSLTDLDKKDKHKSSIGQLASSVGGSLLSIGALEKRKGIKKFAKSLGSKMHLHSKKKQKDGDDLSNSGSFASIGTPNSSIGGGRRFGQRAGEADPGVISEDEDEFVFDNLSHKSSGSSLNIRSAAHAPPPAPNFVPHNPSPLLGSNGKFVGKPKKEADVESTIDLADRQLLEEIEHDFSVRARTLPPPSKPPRTQQQLAQEQAEKQQQNEWETKLYGKPYEKGNSDSLKRHHWDNARVPLPIEEKQKEAEEQRSSEQSDSSSELDSEPDLLPKPQPKLQDTLIEQTATEKEPHMPVPAAVATKPELLKPEVPAPRSSLLSPALERNKFSQFNASFAQFEKRHSAEIFASDDESKWGSQALINSEIKKEVLPMPTPRNNVSSKLDEDVKRADEMRKMQDELKRQEEQQLEAEKQRQEEKARLEAEKQRQREKERLEAEKQRQQEVERLEAEQRLQREQQQREAEAKKQEELAWELEEQAKQREAKRLEEDKKLLNFPQRSISLEEKSEETALPEPQSSPVNGNVAEQRKEKQRLGKFKYLNKRDTKEISPPKQKSSERIIIGHEKNSTHAEHKSELAAALAKKYEGKSREELMLIANGMENEALLQRQRVKELEDYLDNLLLRVMETHPKILQNPYSRTTSAKSG